MKHFLSCSLSAIKCILYTGLLAVFLSSCVGKIIDRVTDIELQPDPMEKPAKGSFSAKVDGKTYTPIRDGFEFYVKWPNPSDQYDRLISISIDAVDKDYAMMGFLVYVDKDLNDILNKPISLEDSFVYYQTGNAIIKLKHYFIKKGTITFRRVQPDKLVGEFNMSVENENLGEIINITDGKFDMYY